jgi:hypothetical protein
VVGLHIRGPGRLDGGVRLLKRGRELQDGVPLALYFRHVDEALDRWPDARILLCSDSERVVDACRRRHGDRLVLYPAARAPNGEPHHWSGPSNRGYKLGEDVLIEAYLLSGVDLLIHGSSNVTNFVLCNAPSLEHVYVYAEEPDGGGAS